jgi:hypothetical protein
MTAMQFIRPATIFLALLNFCLDGRSQERERLRPVGYSAGLEWNANRDWSGGKAAAKGPVRFTHSPMRLEDIETIVPYGMMVGGHVCPIDHGYFYPKPVGPDGRHFDVLVPADGFVVVVGHRTQMTGSTERPREYDDYALTIEHSGTYYSLFDLLTQLDKSITDQLDPSVRIAVKAGQVIGRVGGRSLDFGVVNSEVRLPGFLTPTLYGHYEWRTYVADPLDLFDPSLRTKLLALDVRKTPPYFGKIDYDVDGRVVGNWFREGTGGYPGDRSDPRGYWMGHLAFAYHHLDSSKIVVSIGDFDGKPRQFWVKGNGPDPRNVGVTNGSVKYELVQGGLGNSGRALAGINTNQVHGTVLVQVLQGRKLKLEVFPDKTANEAGGFTPAARTYER